MNAAKEVLRRSAGSKKTFEMEGGVSSAADGAASIGLNQKRDDDDRRGATVVLRADDLARVQKELSFNGVKFEGEIHEVPGVVRTATFFATPTAIACS
jgi:hypothetical protein